MSICRSVSIRAFNLLDLSTTSSAYLLRKESKYAFWLGASLTLSQIFFYEIAAKRTICSTLFSSQSFLLNQNWTSMNAIYAFSEAISLFDFIGALVNLLWSEKYWYWSTKKKSYFEHKLDVVDYLVSHFINLESI